MRRLIDLDVGEVVHVGTATVELKYKSGRKARLFISTAEGDPISHVKPTERPSMGRGIFSRPGVPDQEFAFPKEIG